MRHGPPVPDLSALPPIRDVIARHQLGARRRLGQHFLLDLNLTGRIARAAGPLAGFTVIEVGPGPGGLTRALIGEGAARVIAIERDPRCVEALGELTEASDGRLRVVQGDALKTDIASLCRESGGEPCRIVANLPYNIAVPLLLNWLDQAALFVGFTLMFQKEVADRLCAAPRGKSYGRLSVAAQWRCQVDREFDVSPQAFTPPPKVTSTVISLTPYAKPLAEAEPDTLARVTAAAFGQRRKMLRSSLKTLNVDVAALLATAGVSPTARAEELSIGEFCALARALAAQT